MKRLTEPQIADIKLLYEERGWNYEHLGKKYGVNHSVILRLVKRKGFTRKVLKRNAPPEQIEHFYKRDSSQYAEALRQSESRKPECTHKHWSARCGMCNKVLGSEVHYILIPRHELERNKEYRKLIEKYGN